MNRKRYDAGRRDAATLVEAFGIVEATVIVCTAAKARRYDAAFMAGQCDALLFYATVN